MKMEDLKNEICYEHTIPIEDFIRKICTIVHLTKVENFVKMPSGTGKVVPIEGR